MKMNKNIILACFSGMGKTTAASNERYIDVQKIIEEKYGTEDKQKYYVSTIIDLLEKNSNKVLLINTYSNVLNELKNNDIEYIIISPDINIKNNFMERYQERNDDSFFIKRKLNFFENKVRALVHRQCEYIVVIKNSDVFLLDIIENVIHEFKRELFNNYNDKYYWLITK